MNSAWHGNEDIMAEKVDYGTLKKGGFMRQKQKNNFSLRLAVVGGYLTAENLTKIAEVVEKYGDGFHPIRPGTRDRGKLIQLSLHVFPWRQQALS